MKTIKKIKIEKKEKKKEKEENREKTITVEKKATAETEENRKKRKRIIRSILMGLIFSLFIAVFGFVLWGNLNYSGIAFFASFVLIELSFPYAIDAVDHSPTPSIVNIAASLNGEG